MRNFFLFFVTFFNVIYAYSQTLPEPNDEAKRFILNATVGISVKAYYGDTISDSKAVAIGMIPSLAEKIGKSANDKEFKIKGSDIAIDLVGVYSGVKLGGLIIKPKKGGVFVGYKTQF